MQPQSAAMSTSKERINYSKEMSDTFKNWGERGEIQILKKQKYPYTYCTLSSVDKEYWGIRFQCCAEFENDLLGKSARFFNDVIDFKHYVYFLNISFYHVFNVWS